MKEKSEIDKFILSMNTTTEQIPIVYTQDSENLIIENNGKITDKNTRYKNGKDIVFKCSKCGDIIGRGKLTNESNDNTKIYCYKCKEYMIFSNCLNWSKDLLWHKPQNEYQRKEFEIAINSFIKEKNPKII
jgi:NAD-dependent SIR2 family protein deacetylase